MSDIAVTEDLFFTRSGLSKQTAVDITTDALSNCEDGELFLEYRQSESFSLDDGCIKSAAFDTTQGFGLRSVIGETTGFAHASTLDEGALLRASETIKAVKLGHMGEMADGPTGTNQAL